MRLLNLRIQKFRNLTEVAIAPSPRATIAVGPNGEGKTNLLEAIYFSVTLRPLRAAKLAELIQFGSNTARVLTEFELGGAKRVIQVTVLDGLREVVVDGKRVQRLEEYLGHVPVVAFTPDDLRVVKGAPEGRRQFLDRAIFNRFPAYLREARDYQRALRSRNRLLREGAGSSHLQAFDEALAQRGARIWLRRHEFLIEQAPVARRAFEAIIGGGVAVDFEYRPTDVQIELEGAKDTALAEGLVTSLREKTEYDRDRGFTSVGPHIDDLLIILERQPAKAYGSQGQQRAIILGWKIGEIENLRRTTGATPLLLLDDVSSELDPSRNAYLMHYLSSSGAQFFLTTTDPRLVGDAAGEDAAWFIVRGGALTPRPRDHV